MSDNTSPYFAGEYDLQISKNLPYYNVFHEETLDLIKTIHPKPDKWLDTGCGTGRFVQKASCVFGNTTFFLADPSKKMLAIAENINRNTFEKSTAELDFTDSTFDVVTAILSHHYLSREQRRLSTINCFRMLKENGVYVTFENILPATPKGQEIIMERWLRYKLKNNNAVDESSHFSRFNQDYFPITIAAHLDLLHEAGFQTAELFWMSYMQAGFFAIK